MLIIQCQFVNLPTLTSEYACTLTGNHKQSKVSNARIIQVLKLLKILIQNRAERSRNSIPVRVPNIVNPHPDNSHRVIRGPSNVRGVVRRVRFELGDLRDEVIGGTAHKTVVCRGTVFRVVKGESKRAVQLRSCHADPVQAAIGGGSRR